MTFINDVLKNNTNVRSFTFNGNTLKVRLNLHGQQKVLDEARANPSDSMMALVLSEQGSEVVDITETKKVASLYVWILQKWGQLLNDQDQTFEEAHGRPMTMQDLDDYLPRAIAFELAQKVSEVTSLAWDDQRKNS